jgi:pimeloyl-ACP methyl ester carboxylesterase
VAEAITSIAAPTLVIWGDRDRLVTAPVIDGLGIRRDDWVVHVFSDIGHAPMLECPGEFVAIVESWYAGDLPTEATPAA